MKETNPSNFWQLDSALEIANHSLLEAAHLTEHHLERVLGKAMSKAVDSADIYLQNSFAESWVLEDGLVKKGEFHIDRGFGLRVISGEKTGFAYADDIALSALNRAASSAKNIIHSGGNALVSVAQPTKVPHLYTELNPIFSLTEQEKVALLQQVDAATRALDPRVSQVIVSLTAEHDTVMVLNSDGVLAADVRPLVNLWVRVIVVQDGVREQGSAGGGGRTGYEFFADPELPLSYAKKAVRQALLNLTAKKAPAGVMPVVLGPGWPAVLLHEAVGHGLEGDFNRKGSSAFSGKLGQQVATSLCTIVDDGTIPLRRGSIAVDDEGTISQKTVLVENGILKNYMLDRHNAHLMKMIPTGNGRRESYAHLPQPRMTNTYMLPGESDPQDIIASVEKGIYAVDFSGGQVDITSGQFVFTANEAYMIEKGKVTYPVKGATIIGNGPEVLKRISMVGNDLQLDSGIGSCGKGGQTVPVGVGQPTLKVDALTIGGVEI